MSDSNIHLRDKAKQIKLIADEIGAKSLQSTALELQKHIEDTCYTISFVGEFNRGKSTLVNALLGLDLLPTQIRPTTAVIHKIRYGTEPSIEVHKTSGQVEMLPFDKSVLKKYTAESTFDSTQIDHIAIAYPLEYLQDNVVLVDTPGVADLDEQRADITYGYLPVSDAVVMIFSSDRPFKETERVFLRDKVLKSNYATMFFVVNQIDRLETETDVSHVRDYVSEELRKSLGIEAPNLFCLSASRDLQERVGSDLAQGETNGFAAFESSLTTFIKSGQRASSRRDNLNKLAQLLIQQLIDEISSLEATLDLSFHDIEARKQKLVVVETEKRELFGQLLTFMNQQVDVLVNDVDDRVLSARRETADELSYKIDVADGDLTKYAEKVLPHDINLRLKRLVENMEPLVDKRAGEIRDRVLEGYKKRFSKSVIIESLAQYRSDSRREVASIALQEKDMVKKVKYGTAIGGVVLTGAVALMTGGLGLPVLLAGGVSAVGRNFVSDYFLKATFEQQKHELRAKVPVVVDEVFRSLEEQLHARIRGHFDALGQALDSNFTHTLAEVNAEIDEKLALTAKEREKLDADRVRLSGCKERLIQLQTADKTV